MNRHERRSTAARLRQGVSRTVLCGLGGHDYPPSWVMRPAWVGALVVIPKVHFDRPCRRCGHVQRYWTPIEGTLLPQPEAMPLPAWLAATGGTVTPPAGEIRYPDVGELAAVASAAGIGEGDRA